MGFFSSLFGRSDDDDETEEEELGALPEIFRGMTLIVETTDGQQVLSGQVAEFDEDDRTLALERLPGGLSFKTRELGSTVMIRGIDESLMQFYLKGTVAESTRMAFRVKDVQVREVPKNRQNFRLEISAPVTMYSQIGREGMFGPPEECTMVDISIGGMCVDSEYAHLEDDVVRVKVKLLDYAPMEFLGEIIRAAEPKPGKFRYGILFAQLKEKELEELTRTLYNIQAGNRSNRQRSEMGHW